MFIKIAINHQQVYLPHSHCVSPVNIKKNCNKKLLDIFIYTNEKCRNVIAKKGLELSTPDLRPLGNTIV